MDSKHLFRLQEEQQKAIAETNSRLEQCKKFTSDYNALKDRLQTLPDAVKHDIMVPFGKFGFMPGQLVHTNEVLVLLGDNWFVERSAKQACEIADRRINELKKQMKDLEDQMKLLTPRLDFTSDLQSQLEGSNDVKEIVEEYNEEKEKLWDAQHKENVKKYRKELHKIADVPVVPKTEGVGTMETRCTKTDQELWSRLDELERMEEERGYMNSSAEDSDDDEEKKRDSDQKPKPQVKWADERKPEDDLSQCSTDDDDDDDDDDADDEGQDGSEMEEEEEEFASRPKRTITFRHTRTLVEELDIKDPPSRPPSTTSTGTVATITSPADIYKLFCPKPILKKKSSPKDASSAEAESNLACVPCSSPCQKEETPILTDGGEDASYGTSSAKLAFSGKIVERPAVTNNEVGPASPSPSQPTKRVSKFKAQRMQQTS